MTSEWQRLHQTQLGQMISESNKLTPFEAFAYCFGDIIGSGIFVSPYQILKFSGSIGLSFIIWVAGALIAIIGALVYVELGTKIRKPGCDFAYLTHAGWTPIAVPFLYVSCFLIYPTILAIQTVSFGAYIVDGFKNIMCLDDYSQYVLKHLVGLIALLVLVFINMFSLRSFAGKLQIAVTVSKLAVISLILLVGFYYLIFKDGYKHFDNAFLGTTSDPGDMGMALYASLYAYNGWDILNFGTNEVENPRKSLPIAGLGGILSAAVLYVGINVAYMAVLTKEEFLSGETVAVQFARRSMGDFSYVVPFLIGVLFLGNLNTTIFGCSRYVLAGAKTGYFPSYLKAVNPASMSPRCAVLAELIVAVIISLVADLEHLMGIMTFAMWSQRAIVQICLLWMRYKGFIYPKDAFVTPIFMPVLFFCISIALIVVPALDHYYVAIAAPLLILCGCFVYFVVLPHTNRPFLVKIDHYMLVLFQILLNVDVVEKSD
ncbi:unnamed protein product [Bursaphelenchus okinawaensis]|uniref:Uncharacterized protein n=1 Tax=Bursaphelenchus okinawaensis TaxID=465554 RepID=A0A811K861_9BILA|nr:unnamed protein product [Bursaphelenchus okinawaensis]CAG9095331.1 unnamed protein product [Bursaphelenchus okinawaensis]